VTGPQRNTSFSDVLDILKGLIGQVVDASVFLPHDDGGFPVASFSGVIEELAEVTLTADRWKLMWRRDTETEPFAPSITLWPDGFLEAELSSSGEAEDGFEEIDESIGHNAFIKIQFEDVVADLTVYQLTELIGARERVGRRAFGSSSLPPRR
jgi:hypothetical protein